MNFIPRGMICMIVIASLAERPEARAGLVDATVPPRDAIDSVRS